MRCWLRSWCAPVVQDTKARPSSPASGSSEPRDWLKLLFEFQPSAITDEVSLCCTLHVLLCALLLHMRLCAMELVGIPDWRENSDMKRHTSASGASLMFAKIQAKHYPRRCDTFSAAIRAIIIAVIALSAAGAHCLRATDHQPCGCDMC